MVFFHVAENCHKLRTAIPKMKRNEFAYMSKKIALSVTRARDENKYYTQTVENTFTKNIWITAT